MKSTENWIEALQHTQFGKLLIKYAKLFFLRHKNWICGAEAYINMRKSQYKVEFISKIEDFFNLV